MADLVHAPLARWATEKPDSCAITDGDTQITFKDLYARVMHDASQRQQAPATCWVDHTQSTCQQLIAFLGIVQSGRCAAVSDPDWPAPTHQAVTASLAHEIFALRPTQSTDPFYIGFTSGSTGTPKGFRRHHLSWVESFRVCASSFEMDHTTAILAPGRISHSLFLFGMLMGLWTGAGVGIQNKFSPSHTLNTLRQGNHACLVAVPSQLMMLLQWAQHRQISPISQVRRILISGARWMRQHTEALQQLFPQARIIEFYGASETSFIAWKEANEPASDDAVGRPFANVELQIRPVDPHAPNGLIYVRSPMLFMNYVGFAHDPTAAVRDGDWLSVGDLGHIDAQGHLCLAGRQNRMIVTQGKNLFPEELENLLQTHPNIANASVHALTDPLRGSKVVAVLQFAQSLPQATWPTAHALTQWCQTRTESFKIPRQFFVCTNWPSTASGKTDHAGLLRMLTHNIPTPPTSAPINTACLQQLS